MTTGASSAMLFCGAVAGLFREIMTMERCRLYTVDPFQCKDGSRSIAASRVNDDYCDCDDGSDEPGTSACQNGNFWCENKGGKSKHIFSSRVNDGFCG
jgi:hypothetical protein